MQTHFAVIYFSGDFSEGGHPDPELNGRGPSLTLIAAGPEKACWQALTAWTETHPLRPGESAEVVARDLSLVKARMDLAPPPPDMPRGQYGPVEDYGDDSL